MYTELVTILLAFVEGLGLIISPCILPILPIILSGSLAQGDRRPLGIIVGFIVTFSLFTFFSRQLLLLTGIDLTLIRDISFVLLFIFGVMMMSTYLTDKFSQVTQKMLNPLMRSQANTGQDKGFISGMMFGSCVGLIWTPCAGPILAAVIVQTVIQQTSLMSFLTLVSFGIGAGVPMLMIALFGKRLLSHLRFFRQHAVWCRKALGFIIALTVLVLAYGNVMTSVSTLPTQSSLVETNKNSKQSQRPTMLQDALTTPYKAPDLAGIEAWINSPPLTLASLKGKVVLIDFWAYSCINCIRTLPYLKNWYQQYRDKGFTIIGVHSPEFTFESKIDNVKKAVEQYGIEYPVALDNQFLTWRNYHNHYWPAHYLIDKEGQVVYQHFGEGQYDVTDNNIRYLLGIQATAEKHTPLISSPRSLSHQTPETYLGYQRASQNASPEQHLHDQTQSYTYPSQLPLDAWALSGAWQLTPQYIVSAGEDSALSIHFSAKQVYAVMGHRGVKPLTLRLRLNGQPLTDTAGKDVKEDRVVVSEHTLYHLLDLSNSDETEGVLEIIVSNPDLELYTFTFGRE